MKLSVISPTFNEAENVPTLVSEISRSVEGIDYEILIVDDNSPDLTWSVAEKLSLENPRLRVLCRKDNPGLGQAVIDGFNAAKGDIIACIDADLQHDPSILPRMVDELVSGSDVVVGSRYVDGGGTGNWNVLRRFESRFATKLAQVFLDVRLKDPMSGYFLMRRSDFSIIHRELNAAGFKILLEILVKLQPKVVREVPYTFRVRTAGESKLSGKIVMQYLEQLWRLSRIGRISSWRLLKFGIVGASGVLVNLLVMASLLHVTHIRDWGCSAVASLVANVSNYVFNNKWTFADRAHRGMQILRGYIYYLIMSSIGLSCTTGTYVGLTWSLRRLHLSQNLDGVHGYAVELSMQLIAIAVGMLFNYELNHSFTWPHVERDPANAPSARDRKFLVAGPLKPHP